MPQELTRDWRQIDFDLQDATRAGDAEDVARLLAEGADVNWRDPSTNQTALHLAAAYNAVAVIHVLIKCKDLDYASVDSCKQTPATLAYTVANNPVVGRFLMRKEYEQIWRVEPQPA